MNVITITGRNNPYYPNMVTDDEWACNENRCGVFSRTPDGSWAQNSDTDQTPQFRDPAHFKRYLYYHYNVRGRITFTSGWYPE